MNEQAGLSDPTDPWAIDTVEIGDRRVRVFRSAPATLRDVWLASAAHADRTFLVYDDERWTYAEAHRRVAALADRWVRVDGVRQGDRIAIACRNHPEWAMAFWATVSIGAVAVPLNAWWTGPELAYGLEHSGSVVLVADDERLERVEPHLGSTAVRSIVTVRTDRTIPGSVTFESASTTEGSSPSLPAADIAPDDDATIMYTSGTTGRPKGAVGTHRNMIGHIMNSAYRGAQAAAQAASASTSASTGSTTPPTPPVTLLTFPLFHVGGLQSFLAPFTLSGGTVVMMYKWDARQALELIEREQVTTMAAVPTTLIELLELAAAEGRSLGSLGGVSSGATLVPPELVRRIDTQLEHRTAPGNGYGLTETSGAAIANFGADYVARPDSVGRPISPVMGVRIMDPADPDGDPLPAGEVGEIWLSGPTVVRGYFEDPVATAAAFVDGWFRTGDLGRLDDDGFLYVVDRLKDVVIRGGENVYAAEVEAAIFEHPDVTEAAVFGVPHERLGEEVAAAVRVRPGSTATAEALREHVAARLAAFKVPAHVHLTGDELPKNATGKVLKRELRDRHTPAPGN